MAASTYLSVCSGIGGLDLGVGLGSGDQAEPGCYLEREATAAAVLARAMAVGILPQGPVWSDLKSFSPHEWAEYRRQYDPAAAARFDGIVGGYPCQPFSQSGHRRGAADPRHLFPDIARLIEQFKPTWCFFENVSGHLSLGYFTEVKPTLEGLDYRVEEQVCKASDVGATHARERLFILAVANTASRSRIEPFLPAENCLTSEAAEAAHEPRAPGGPVVRLPDESRGSALADADLGRRQEEARPVGQGGEAGPARTAAEPDRAVGYVARPPFPPAFDDDEGWDLALDQYPQGSPLYQPRVRGVVDGTALRIGLRPEFQLHALGNSVVPGQAALAWQLLWAEVLS